MHVHQSIAAYVGFCLSSGACILSSALQSRCTAASELGHPVLKSTCVPSASQRGPGFRAVTHVSYLCRSEGAGSRPGSMYSFCSPARSNADAQSCSVPW